MNTSPVYILNILMYQIRSSAILSIEQLHDLCRPWRNKGYKKNLAFYIYEPV